MSHESNLDDPAIETMRWNLDAMSMHPGELYPPRDIRNMIHATGSLPPLPETAYRLLDLMNAPDADALGLAAVIEQDPLLASQTLRWANSAFYGLKQPVDSVREAVARVLGFEQAAGLALGLSTMSPLNTPREGPVGRDAVWRHALLAGRLMQDLRDLLPEHRRPGSGMTYLAGLTQNIGHLLLGHLLPSQFAFLNHFIRKNPRIRLPVADNFALGVDHAQLGHWLLEAWQLPAPLLTAVRHHHNPAYSGLQHTLVQLTCLADQLLAGTGNGLGPAPVAEETEDLARLLELDPAACTQVLENTLSSGP